jgi:serine/threonine protein kinase
VKEARAQISEFKLEAKMMSKNLKATRIKKIDIFYYNSDDEPLGTGIVSKTFKGWGHDTTVTPSKETTVTIKVIPMKVLYLTDLELFSKQIKFISEIKGRHLVPILDVYVSKNSNYYIVSDYIYFSSLSECLLRERNFGLRNSFRVLSSIAQAFLELENYTSGERYSLYLHGHLRPSNIFIYQNHVLLSDYGFGNLIENTLQRNKHDEKLDRSVFSSYMSPQQLENQPYSSKCDIWSMGMIFYQLIYSKLPWKGGTKSQLIESIRTEKLKFPQKRYIISGMLEQLISKMLSIEEKERPTWREIYEQINKQEIKKNHILVNKSF